MRDRIAIPQSKTLTHNPSSLKELHGQTIEQTEKKEVKRQSQRGIQFKGSSQSLTVFLSLWCAHKKEPVMADLLNNQ